LGRPHARIHNRVVGDQCDSLAARDSARSEGGRDLDAYFRGFIVRCLELEGQPQSLGGIAFVLAYYRLRKTRGRPPVYVARVVPGAVRP
jgi:hypothetical protein